MNTAVLTLAALLVLIAPAGASAGTAESAKSLIARSQIWFPRDTRSMDLVAGPTGPGSFAPGATIECDYVNKKMSGASPKFTCRLPDGEELKVKYGGTNGEVYGEVAASRLLWALGFGADRMYSVRVICRGCPMHIGGILRTDNNLRILDPAVVERKLPGEELLDRWSWRDLDLVDEAAGGATVAQRDALKLLAVMMQHNDTKPQQQRLVCLDERYEEGARCVRPLMMLNDVGLTFGVANRFNLQPRGSVHLYEWSRVPVWKDAASCVGNLAGSVTGTLKYPAISEAGRRFLADRLLQLSDAQLHDLFTAARVHLRPRDPGRGRSGFPDAGEWVAAFKQKRAEIVDRRCAA